MLMQSYYLVYTLCNCNSLRKCGRCCLKHSVAAVYPLFHCQFIQIPHLLSEKQQLGCDFSFSCAYSIGQQKKWFRRALQFLCYSAAGAVHQPARWLKQQEGYKRELTWIRRVHKALHFEKIHQAWIFAVKKSYIFVVQTHWCQVG